MALYLIQHGEAKVINKKKHPGNAGFVLVLVISLLLSAVSTGTLADETGKNKDKKEQTQFSQAKESPKKLELQPKAKPLRRSEADSRAKINRFKQIITAGEEKKYTGEPGTFIFHEADIKDVLLFFGKTYKMNIVIDPGVSGKVTLRLVDVPWDQALDLILRQHGLAMTKNGNLITAKQLKK